jgi:hypothetical protein
MLHSQPLDADSDGSQRQEGLRGTIGSDEGARLDAYCPGQESLAVTFWRSPVRGLPGARASMIEVSYPVPPLNFRANSEVAPALGQDRGSSVGIATGCGPD